MASPNAEKMIVKLTALSIVALATLGLAACSSGAPAAAPPVTTARIATTTTTSTPADEQTQGGTGDRAATNSLRNAFTAAMVSYTDNASYSRADVAELTAIEPALKFQTTASTAPDEISVVAVPGAQIWWATVRSDSGRCFGIEDDALVGTTFAGTATKLASCQAPASDPHWTDARW